MEKIDVAVHNGPGNWGYTGYIVEHGDESALEKAKDWARERNYNYETKEYGEPYEPNIYTFDNKGFTVKILNSAGGSSQGGRLSFWMCEIEKDDIKFTVGVNDAILADLIKNSDISNGLVKQEVMFARKGGQPGLIHEGMDAYQDAVADMKQKADLKKAKKTNKWEIGGVYSTLTQTDVCFGEVYDTMEEYQQEYTAQSGYRYGGYSRTRTALRKAKTPTKVLAWTYLSSYRHKSGIPDTFNEFLKEELSGSIYFSTGKPPARNKAKQLEVTEEDLKLIDELLAKREEYAEYGQEKVKGRYVRELK